MSFDRKRTNGSAQLKKVYNSSTFTKCMHLIIYQTDKNKQSKKIVSSVILKHFQAFYQATSEKFCRQKE